MKGEPVRLSIVQSDHQCVFYLTHQNHPPPAKVAYSDEVMRCYDEWRRAYLNFYRNQRGRKEAGGVVAIAPPDRAAILETAKINLLNAFETWLKDGSLLEIRDYLINLARRTHQHHKGSLPTPRINLFLSCDSLKIARLPWESWSLLTDNNLDAAQIRLFRTQSANQTLALPRSPSVQRRKPRILVIIGEDGHLDFQKDFAAIQQKLARKVDLHRIGWQPNKDLIRLKQEIATTIADPNGWDVLYFAGHSNETTTTGGELAIAPNVSLQVSDLQPDLKMAIQQGLQFAFFNSCSGMSIADSLIQLGLSQAAVMREPIANAVAQQLLLSFLEKLAQHQDVSDALTAACQYLKTSKERFKYPSAYLVPSLYCTPDATLFHLPQKNWRRLLQPWMPTRWEAISVSSIVFLSLLYPMQDWLIAKRLLVQAIYRDITSQTPTEQVPVLLVEIDQDSIDKEKITKSPMDREYLAHLIQKVARLSPKVIGVDFSLVNSTAKDSVLSKAVEGLVKKEGTWLVFGVHETATAEERSNISKIADPRWSLQGSMDFTDGFVELPADSNCLQICPFSYWLTLAQTTKQTSATFLPSPQFSANLKTSLIVHRDHESVRNDEFFFLKGSRIPASSQFSRMFFGDLPQIEQLWLHPIIDFSIPPSSVHSDIPAWKLLELSHYKFPIPGLQTKVVIIVPRFPDAGIQPGIDNFPAPDAFIYWWQKNKGLVYPESQKMSGGEVHAYMVHHLLSRHLVVPIPDLWLIGIAVILGKATLLSIKNKSCLQQRQKILYWAIFGTGIYGTIGLQVYVSGALLLPWCFPALVFWLYLTPTLRRMFYE